MQTSLLSIIVVAVFHSYGISASKLDQFVNVEFQRSDHYRQQICNLQDVNNYVRRYVNTFLRYTKLANKVNDVAGNDFVHAKVHLRLTGDQLTLLQKIYHEKNYVPTLDDLDKVFSSIMYQSTADQVEDYVFWLFSFFEMTYQVANISLPQAVSFVILGIFLYKWLLNGMSRLLIAQTFGALIAVEGFKRYLFKLREANFQHYLQMKQLGVLTEECDSSNLGLLGQTWVSFKNLFREDPCVQAYMHATGHYAEEVSLVESIIEPLLSAISLVMKHIGIYVRDICAGMMGNSIIGQGLSVLMYPIVLFTVIGTLLHIFFPTNINFSSFFASVRVSKNNDYPPAQAVPPPPPPPLPQPAHPPLESYIRDLRSILRLARPIRAAGSRRNSKRQLSAGRFPLEAIPDPPKEIEEKLQDPDEELEFEDCIETLEESKNDKPGPKSEKSRDIATDPQRHERGIEENCCQLCRRHCGKPHSFRKTVKPLTSTCQKLKPFIHKLATLQNLEKREKGPVLFTI